MEPGALQGAALWSSQAPHGHRRAECWAREEGGAGGWARDQEVCFRLVSPCLFNLSPGVTGRVAAPLRRPFPGRCLGRRRTLAETRWRGRAAHTAGGVPRTRRPPRSQGSGNDSPRGGSAPVAASLAGLPCPRSGPGNVLPPAATPPLDSSQLTCGKAVCPTGVRGVLLVEKISLRKLGHTSCNILILLKAKC